MTLTFSTLADIFTHDFDTVIDVRSPSEFAEDHLPGAVNLPVLSDQERAEVGRIYVRENPFKARKIGAALVARNASHHLEGPLACKEGGWQPLVYCWRGGQRSGSFASILRQIGWRVELLEGGYRSYRRLVVKSLYEDAFLPKVFLLDGLTGTAKTEILHKFDALGGQIIDLESLANHRGSVFGGTLEPQPSQKAFEGALAKVMAAVDPARPVLIEAESSKIGDRLVPPSLWAAMKAAPRLRISAPLQERAAYLARTYSDVVRDPDVTKSILAKLSPFFSAKRMGELLKLVDEGDFLALASTLMEEHYDGRYRKGAMVPEFAVELSRLDEDAIGKAAHQLLDHVV